MMWSKSYLLDLQLQFLFCAHIENKNIWKNVGQYRHFKNAWIWYEASQYTNRLFATSSSYMWPHRSLILPMHDCKLQKYKYISCKNVLWQQQKSSILCEMYDDLQHKTTRRHSMVSTFLFLHKNRKLIFVVRPSSS